MQEAEEARRFEVHDSVRDRGSREDRASRLSGPQRMTRHRDARAVRLPGRVERVENAVVNPT